MRSSNNGWAITQTCAPIIGLCPVQMWRGSVRSASRIIVASETPVKKGVLMAFFSEFSCLLAPKRCFSKFWEFAFDNLVANSYLSTRWISNKIRQSVAWWIWVAEFSEFSGPNWTELWASEELRWRCPKLFQISDMSLLFETGALQRQLESKVESKFQTYRPCKN